MSSQYSPSIVTSGLLMYLDAANFKSYPRSGTTWSDLNNSGYSGSLINTPVYSSSSLGMFNFNGVDEYVYLTPNLWNHDTNLPFTISTWFRTSSTLGGTILGQQNTSDPASAPGYLPAIYVQSDGKVRMECFWAGSIVAVTSSLSYNDNRFHNVTCVYSDGVEYLYMDSVLVSSKSGITQTNYGANYYYFIGVSITTGRNLGNQYFSGSISNFSFYNRALSASEIVKNFNSLKGRYLLY